MSETPDKVYDGLLTALLNAEHDCGAYDLANGNYQAVYDVRKTALEEFEAYVAQLRRSSESRERVEKALRALFDAVVEREDLEEEDYDPALIHNFNYSMKAIMVAMTEARSALHAASKEGV